MDCVIYTRVSTNVQDNKRQIEELEKYAEYKQYNVLKIFEEIITGASKTTERTAFNQLNDYINQNEIKCVLIWELSRLGRKMSDVITTIEDFSNKKVNIYSKKENLNTLNAKGEKDILTNLCSNIRINIIRDMDCSGRRKLCSTYD